MNFVIASIVLILIGLITFLLIKGKIGSQAYTILFICIILCGLALFGFDRLKEINFRNLTLTLNEMKEVKKDVYAKVETVKKLGEEIARLVAFNTSMNIGSIPNNLGEKAIEVRNRIITVLRETRSDSTKIKEITTELDRAILLYLKFEVRDKIHDIIPKVQNKKNMDSNEIYDHIDMLLFKNYNRDVLNNYLEQKNIYNEELKNLLDKVDAFLSKVLEGEIA